MDPSQDGRLHPLDVLLVINYLNELSRVGARGESAGRTFSGLAADVVFAQSTLADGAPLDATWGAGGVAENQPFTDSRTQRSPGEPFAEHHSAEKDKTPRVRNICSSQHVTANARAAGAGQPIASNRKYRASADHLFSRIKDLWEDASLVSNQTPS